MTFPQLNGFARFSVSVSYRVLRQGRVCVVRLKPC